jgi:hypothetical protein
MNKSDPPALQVRSDAGNHGNLEREDELAFAQCKAWLIRRTAPDNNLKPSVRSKPLVAKKVCLADSPETTTTVF